MKAWIKQAKANTEPKTREASEGVDPELLTRTSWVDAQIALRLVEQGKVTGNKCALLIRGHIQSHLFKLGCFQQRHCGKVLILGLLCLSLFAVGLKTAVIESDINKLWVEEGGRLAKELEYTESILGTGYGSSNQIIVQTPGPDSKNVLTRKSLLRHLQALVEATQVEVHLFDKVWRFEDICLKATLPSFEDGLIEMMLLKLLPCLVISPLDCFWEGSKVLGPRNPLVLPPSLGIDPLTWKNLNPELLISTLEMTMDYRFDAIKDTLRRAGIVSGYQRKPCLDPFDPECPVEAPNYRSAERVESVAGVVTGGCSGFAPEYMHWEEDMIVGGVIKNRSNTMVSAEAIQSVVQLMGEQDLYNYYQGTYQVSSIEWTQEKARQILEAFQTKFTEEVVVYNKQSNISDSVSSFTQASLDELIESFSEVSYLRIAIGYALMLVYAALSLINLSDAVHSHAGIGVAGVALVSVSVAAGLGLCSLLKLPFNATTTQIVPFIALGLGVDDMFLMAHTFSHRSSYCHTEDHQDQAGELLKRTGCTVLLTSISNASAFLLAALVPIPALRIFSLQVGILLIFNLISMLLVYPAILSFDVWRKKNFRIDVVCCIEAPSTTKVRDISVLPPPSPPSPSSPPLHGRVNTVAVAEPSDSNSTVVVMSLPEYADLDNAGTFSNSGSSQNLTNPAKSSLCNNKRLRCHTSSLSWLVERFYLPLLEKTSFKVIICVLSVTLLCVGAYGISQVKVGMELTDVVPRGTNEHTFLEAQAEYFGFYDMYIVTKDDFQYQLPKNQKMLKELHHRISKVENVIQNDDGGNPYLWLNLMIKWLKDLQNSYDNDVQLGRFHSTGWYPNASDDAMLAYKLLIQTGDINNPIDYSRATYLKLVDDNGIIASDAFYNYLTAWVYNDPLAYDISQSTIRPESKEWYYVPADGDFLIPKSQAIVFARMPFYLYNLGTTEEIIKCIQEIREICDTYTDLGIGNYPTGIVFTFWEQYLNIRYYLLISLAAVLSSIFFIVTLMLMNPLSGFLVTVTLAIITSELFGFMGLVGVKLSAVPVVILVASVGIGVEFTIHVMTGFITSIGDGTLRIKRSLSHMFTPVLHGAVSTLLGVVMLAVSEFDFIVRYFFLSFLALVVLGIFNGLFFLPVLLSLCGPSGEIQPENKNATCIDPPTPACSPPPSPVVKPRRRRSLHKPSKHRYPSDVATLSTISEEPSQISTSSSDREMTVVPRVDVETTIIPNSTHRPSHSTSSSQHARKQRRHPVTRLKTKATVTVEVHTEIPGCAGESPPQCRKSSRGWTNEGAGCTCSDGEESETSL